MKLFDLKMFHRFSLAQSRPCHLVVCPGLVYRFCPPPPPPPPTRSTWDVHESVPATTRRPHVVGRMVVIYCSFGRLRFPIPCLAGRWVPFGLHLQWSTRPRTCIEPSSIANSGFKVWLWTRCPMLVRFGRLYILAPTWVDQKGFDSSEHHALPHEGGTLSPKDTWMVAKGPFRPHPCLTQGRSSLH